MFPVRMMLFLCTLFLLEAPLSGAEEVWRWKDRNNALHFTDSLHNVPRQYRSSAQKITLLKKSKKGSAKPALPPTPRPRSKSEEFTPPPRLAGTLIEQLRKELDRDRKILGWINNGISIKTMKDLFSADLVVKRRLLEQAKTENNSEFQDQIDWLTENIKAETSLLKEIPRPNPGNYYLFSKIKESVKNGISPKEEFLKNLLP
ncbi:MAG: hypothetical protein ACE5FU_05655 [Nitrospinota bacterium]